MAIGPFDFDVNVSQEERDFLRPGLEEMADKIGWALKSITVMTRSGADMGDYDAGTPGLQPAWGWWKGWVPARNRREIWVWNGGDQGLAGYRCIPNLQHEGQHAFKDLELEDWQLTELRKLMHPKPNTWNVPKGTKWGKIPDECYAVHASAALFEIKNPAYLNLLDRQIYKSDYSNLIDILMAGKGIEGGSGVPMHE